MTLKQILVPVITIEDDQAAHEVAFRILQALVAVHVLGVVVETIRAKDALAPGDDYWH